MVTLLPCVKGKSCLAWFAISLLALTSSNAQESPIRNHGGMDEDFPVPSLTQLPSQPASATGIAELQIYAQKVGTSAWRGMQATGTMTYANAPDPLPTTLTMLPGNRARMVVTTSKGDTVTCTNGAFGHAQQAGGRDAGLPALATAAGIAPFDLPGMAALSPSGYSIVDRGATTLENQSLHRISIETVLQDRDAGAGADSHSVTDFYFDSETHLLRKSASVTLVPGAGRHRFVRVLTYANYKTSGAILIPTLISETLDGRATWSLQLNTIDTATPIANTAVF